MGYAVIMTAGTPRRGAPIRYPELHDPAWLQAAVDQGLTRTDIAAKLGRNVTALAPTRNKLISKGMIWSPGHGDTAFTVPLFDEFMRRTMPGNDW